MVGPDYVNPEAPMLDDYNETQGVELNAGEVDYSSWWLTFNDPVLEPVN